MTKKIFILFLITLTIFSCKRIDNGNNQETGKSTELKNTEKNYSDELLMSTIWFQRAAERRALSYQAFNLAKLSLDKKLSEIDSQAKPAIVVDIDETMLDNSPYEAKLINSNESYSSKSWKEWSKLAAASAIPGAVEFCNYAYNHGVSIFYISNRKADETNITINNMARLSFPDLERSHFLLKTDSSSKKVRRAKVKEQYDILLLIGDNLADFSEVFEDRSDNFGFNTVDSFKNEFGDSFIMLPNPMYGDWVKAIYNGNNKLPEEEKEKLRRKALISF